MYSYNDWRSYELYHASAFPGKGFVKGKNTPEYNKWYYITHPEKWGITKAAVGMYDKAKDAVNEMINESETKADDNIRSAVSNLAKGDLGAARYHARSAVSNVRDDIRNAPKNAKNRVNNFINNTSTKADDNLRSAVSNLAKGDVGAARYHARSAVSNVRDDVSNAARGLGRSAKDMVNNYINNTPTKADDNLRSAVSNLARGNTGAARYHARSAVADARRDIGNAVNGAYNNAKGRVNEFINNTPTKADDNIRSAVSNLAKGDTGAARYHARSAVSNIRDDIGRTAQRVGEGAKDRVNEFINNTPTKADDNLRSAVSNLAKGDTGAARYHARSAVSNVRDDLGNAARNVGSVIGGATVGAGRAAKSAVNNFINNTPTKADDNLRSAVSNLARGDVGAARYHARSAVSNIRSDIENARQTAEQGYRYGQALANAQREYDASPNPNSKRMLDIAQRDYDNYTKGNRVAQIGAAAGRAGKSLNNAMNDVERAVGNQVESVRDRNAAARDLETARENEANARSSYNELARQSSNARGRMMDRAEETGDPVSAQNAFRDEISRRDARADEARENIPAAQRQTREAEGAYNRAQDRYNQTPLGRAENAARDLKNSAGTAVEAKIEATKAVKDAVSDYWDAVDQYGANSPQAKAAARAAEGKMSSAAVGIIGRFGNAKNTIEGVIEDGQEMMDRLLRRGDWGSTNPTGSPDYRAEADNRRNNR